MYTQPRFQVVNAGQVTDALDLAQRLGLTVVRTWAFTDGTAQFAPLQPELGQLDSAIFAYVSLLAGHDIYRVNLRI